MNAFAALFPRVDLEVHFKGAVCALYSVKNAFV